MICPLCSSPVIPSLNGLLELKLWHCHNCELVFKDPELQPSQEDEKARYLEHRNDAGEKGYVDFLKQAIDPALPFLNPAWKVWILDAAPIRYCPIF
jgi:hypothetical protein